STARRINERRGSASRASAPDLLDVSGVGLHRRHLPPLVVPALRADTVRNVRRAALRARIQLRQVQHAVVRPPHPLTAARRLSLGDSHKINSTIEFERIEYAPRRR